MVDLLRIKDNISKIQSIESFKIFGQNYEETPFFTIAIPTYKRASFLKVAIESALNQEYEKYNIIVCDNNPERNDETEIMMKQYQGNSKITYYKHSKNVGMAGNWNKCAMLSNSDRIILLHDDDVIYPNALLTFQECLNHVDKNWSLIKPILDKFQNTPKFPQLSLTSNVMYKLHLVNFIKGCAVGAPTCILLNKQKIKEVGGFGFERFPCIDYEMSIKLSRYGHSYIYWGENHLGAYRIAANESLSEETMDKFFLYRSEISLQLMEYLMIPKFLRTTFDSIFEQLSLKETKDYYNMPTYCLKNNKKAPSKFAEKSIIRIYFLLIRIILKINKKTFR